jgi:hypothetical protein
MTVNGNPLVTTRPVTRLGDEWFLPLVPIAQAVGAELQITGDPQQLNVRRSDGTPISYDSRNGEVRSRVVLIGRIKGFEQVQMVGLNGDLLFPLNGVVALLGVDIYEDRGRNLLVIQTSNVAGSRAHSGGSLLNLGTVDYNYGLTTNGSDYGEFANFRSQILAGNARTTESLILSGIQGSSAPRLIQGWIRADLPSNRAVVIGDQSTYSGVEAFTNSVRGVDLETPFKALFSNFYAGRAVSTSFATVGPLGVAKYDTNLIGFGLRRTARNQEFVLAGNHFRNPDRRGTAFGAAYRVGNRTDQFRIQSSFGRFSGSTLQPSSTIELPIEQQQTPITAIKTIPVSGPALGLTVTNTFNPAKYITVTGQVERYGKDFLSIRDDSRFTGQFNKSASVVLRPAQSLSLNGSASDRLFLQTQRRSRNYGYGANATLPGARNLQWSAFRSVQTDDASPLGRFVLEQFSVSAPSFKSYSLYTYYSRIRLGRDLVRNVNVVLVSDRGRYGRFGIHDQVQLGTTNRYGVDWTLQSRTHDEFIRAGIDRSQNLKQVPTLAQSVGMKVPLPGRHSLLFTFTREGLSKMLQLEFGGHVDRHREFSSDGSSRPVVVVRVRITGRVYLDSDFNGEFNAKIDAPMPDIAVWLDEDKVVRTDAQGIFRFDDIATSAHRVHVALEGVPADLVFADLAERTTAVAPYSDNTVNFRIVRAGRITGRVTYLDYTADTAKPVERPATDVRIVATGDRDTFSEASGNFLLSDLPPGTYELQIDTETIPQFYTSKPATVSVEVKPGKTSEGVQFQLAVPPRPVIEKSLPIQQGGQ